MVRKMNDCSGSACREKDDTDMLTSDEYAFLEDLFQQYGGRIRGHCLRLTSSLDSADECTQMTFLAAAEQAGRLMAHPNPAGWLYVTALHMVRRLRGAGAKAAARMDIEDPAVDALTASPSGEDRMETSLDVSHALTLLGDEERRLYRRIFEQGMDYARIAREDSTTEAAVKMRAMRLRKRMKKILED